MAGSCPHGTPGCEYNAATQRHSHRANDLIQIGQRCSCGANAWRVVFGGLLPAFVRCGDCAAGFNIGERLRTCAAADLPIHRRAGRW